MAYTAVSSTADALDMLPDLPPLEPGGWQVAVRRRRYVAQALRRSRGTPGEVGTFYNWLEPLSALVKMERQRTGAWNGNSLRQDKDLRKPVGGSCARNDRFGAAANTA